MRKLLLLLIFWAVSGAAAAQFMPTRILPPAGERGILGPALDFPLVSIGSATGFSAVLEPNRVLRMTPGAQIYDQHNRTIVHGQLPPGSQILFLREQTGDVQRIYILTEQELAFLVQAGRR